MVLQTVLNSKTKTITAAAILIGSSSLASRLLGVVRDRLLVGTFGAGDMLDAYYASFQVPNILFNLLISGTLSIAFIPIFTKYWSAGQRDDVWEVTNSIMNLVALVMGSLAAALISGAVPLTRVIAPGFSGEKFALTVQLTRLMLLSTVLFSLSAVVGGVMNATKRFLTVAIAPLVYNLSIIAAIVIVAPLWGIWGVASGVVLGAGLFFFIHVVGAWAAGYRYRPVLNLRHRGVRDIGRLFIPRVFAIDVSQVSLLVGTMIGSTFVVGSVAIFNLAVNIESVPIGVLATPFAIAAFPNLSQAIAQKNFPQFVAAFSYTARQILFFLLPITVLTIVLRAHIIRLIIGTRQLSWDDTRLAAAALGIFAVGFAAQGLTPLFSRAFYALKDTVRPLIASGSATLINVAATIAFVRLLEVDGAVVEAFRHSMRLEGIVDLRVLSLPIGFTIASILNACVLAVWLRARYGPLEYSTILLRAVPISLASVASGVAAYFTLQLMTPVVNTRTFMGIFGQMTVATMMGAGTYAMVSLLLKSKEMWQFARSLERRMVRLVGPVDISGAEEL